MSLTEQKIRQFKPKDKVFYVADDEGLSLKIEPTGVKSWSYRYSIKGTNKRPRIKLGIYPEISLKQARAIRDEKKELLENQHSPQDQILIFSDVAQEWLDFKKRNALEDKPRCGVIELAHISFDKEILPRIGNKAFSEVKRLDLVNVVRQIEARGVKEPVKKACSYLNQLYDYAVAMGYCEYNLAHGLQKILITQKIKKNYPYLRQDDLGEFFQRLNNVKAHPISKKALWLKMYTGVRGAEILSAEFDHFDLDQKIWKIPAQHVKQFRRKVLLGFDIPDYIVPLSHQAVEIVQSAMQWSAGDRYVFSSPKQPNHPLHFNTLNTMIRRMGYSSDQLSAHGLRSTLSTLLNESGLFQSTWIEAQLSHTDKDKTRASYNHAEYLEQRKEMMQWWADYLEQYI